MPNKDGFEAATEIRRHDTMTPIISMTSMNQIRLEDLTRAGMNAYLPKPLSLQNLLKLLWEFLGKRLSEPGASGGAGSHHNVAPPPPPPSSGGAAPASSGSSAPQRTSGSSGSGPGPNGMTLTSASSSGTAGSGGAQGLESLGIEGLMGLASASQGQPSAAGSASGDTVPTSGPGSTGIPSSDSFPHHGRSQSSPLQIDFEARVKRQRVEDVAV
jgi:CheY-like chemotaxis protein